MIKMVLFATLILIQIESHAQNCGAFNNYCRPLPIDSNKKSNSGYEPYNNPYYPSQPGYAPQDGNHQTVQSSQIYVIDPSTGRTLFCR
jgi:hypothetical protein